VNEGGRKKKKKNKRKRVYFKVRRLGGRPTASKKRKMRRGK
jgi:hypothetical protein